MINIEQVSQVTIGKNAVHFTAVRLSVGIGQYIAMMSTVVRPYSKTFSSQFQSCFPLSPLQSFIIHSAIRQIGFYFAFADEYSCHVRPETFPSNFPREIIDDKSGA